MSLPNVSYDRRPTRAVRVGEITIGGGYPVVVQSMITEETHNVPGSVAQIIAMHKAGAEIVRVTTPNLQEARCLADIKAQLKAQYQDVPLVADVHHQGSDIAVEVAKYVDKIRINPGLFVFRKRTDRIEYSDAEIAEEQAAIERELLPVIEACKRYGRAMRVGVNHGSLAERLTVTYGDTPEGMVQSAIEYLQICERHDFRDIVISLKASRVPIMLQANRLMCQRMAELNMDYPLHLGVTEAGSGQYARIKSTTGIGTLLAEGIGDTIRVSLSEDPVAEIPVCYDILQSLGIRRTKVEFISCPSCGRTKFDLPTIEGWVQAATKHLAGNLTIAVMGCIVNGPGEMADADYGYVGKAGGKISLYRGRAEVKTGIPQEKSIEELVNLIKADGLWRDPFPGWQVPEPPQALQGRITVASGANVIPLTMLGNDNGVNGATTN